jgi:hypothetical protein
MRRWKKMKLNKDFSGDELRLLHRSLELFSERMRGWIEEAEKLKTENIQFGVDSLDLRRKIDERTNFFYRKKRWRRD